jgi:hypothetical protein
LKLKSKTAELELEPPLFTVLSEERPLDVEAVKLFSETALSWVCQHLKQDVQEALTLFFFEVNDAQNRSYLTGLLKLRFEAYQKKKCLSAFEIRCDESNNPPSVIDANNLNIDIWVQLGDAFDHWTHNVHGWTRKL